MPSLARPLERQRTDAKRASLADVALDVAVADAARVGVASGGAVELELELLLAEATGTVAGAAAAGPLAAGIGPVYRSRSLSCPVAVSFSCTRPTSNQSSSVQLGCENSCLIGTMTCSHDLSDIRHRAASCVSQCARTMPMRSSLPTLSLSQSRK